MSTALNILGSICKGLEGSVLSSARCFVKECSISVKSWCEKRHYIFYSILSSLYLLYSSLTLYYTDTLFLPNYPTSFLISSSPLIVSVLPLVCIAFYSFLSKTLIWVTRSLAFSKACFWYSGTRTREMYWVKLGRSSFMKGSFTKASKIGYTGLKMIFLGLKIF